MRCCWARRCPTRRSRRPSARKARCWSRPAQAFVRSRWAEGGGSRRGVGGGGVPGRSGRRAYCGGRVGVLEPVGCAPAHLFPGAAPMMWEREKGAPGHRSNGRCPGIDHLYANAGKVIDIARSDREIAADGYPGDLHVGRLERPTGTAAMPVPPCCRKRSPAVELEHPASKQLVERPLDACFQLL